MIARTRPRPTSIATLLIASAGCAVPLPTTPAAGPDSYQAVADKTDWGWNGQEATIAASVRRAPGELAIDVTRAADQPGSVRSPLAIRVLRRGEPTYVWRGHAGSVFVIAGDLLVRAEYDPTSSGCTLACVDLATGRERWRTNLEALGAVEHWEYENAVAMYLLDPGHVIVYGREAAGRYVEILAVTTGKTVGHKRFAASDA